MTYAALQAIHLPYEVYLDLELHLLDTRPDIKPGAFIQELVQHWLALDKERHAVRTQGQALRGFQWKSVFLPDGTRLRTSYQHNVEFATVVSEQIVADDGQVLTPSQFANRQASARNAWRFVWLRLPAEDYWVRADQFRSRVETGQQQHSMNQHTLAEKV
ncbi:hypothetical protein ACFFKC_12935 [Pseudoduganella danionis]|uniref:Uncharacterized protein n=1 Tax=Pseudoduganella danionis TaxID=1890295 RepID=A0ABW9STE0_9BURK|nr:hypothetical protein [Pseudoduganella danionis]MTW35446.1 hypothetical protein [Pseudoduganella danionis]